MYKSDNEMYITAMRQMSVAEARADLAELLRDVQQEPVEILRRGEAVAVVISSVVYARLLESLEEYEDLRDFDDAQLSTEPRIPWEQVKSDLGIA